jgi:type II secretory ATPase GspE/PulE/Tfp pilus assembly ATPase PilB-like protein
VTELDWAHLADTLRSKGVEVPESPTDGVEPSEEIAVLNGVDSTQGLTWLADKLNVLPFDLLRATCSTRAEDVFRNLAFGEPEGDKWLPFGTLGPLILCAHYNPCSSYFWEIPADLILPVMVPKRQYDLLRADVYGRLAFKALDRTEPLKAAERAPVGESLQAVVQWLLSFYPFSDEIRLKMGDLNSQLSANKIDRYTDIQSLPANYPLALYHLATGEHCFNADHAPPQDAFPEILLEKHGVYPMYNDGKTVYLLANETRNFSFEDEWISTGNEGQEFRMVLAEKALVIGAINRNRTRSVSSTTEAQVGELTMSDVANLVEIDPQEVQRINPSSINTTPEQIVHWVLYRAVTGRASDLHVEKFYNTARFRARIDGELKTIHSCPEELLPRFISLMKNYANMGQRRQDAQDARFSMMLGKRRVDCRVSAIPCRKDLQKLTIRFLDKQDGIKKLSELHLSKQQIEIFSKVMGRDQGLILITGPTGSGKTTTLYALLNSINSENINIHTIEDPIEYEIEGLNQTQTDVINGINFAEGLRRLMRADPDVILIGETRDEETANAAVNAALTGHLVLTTLHANDSLRAVSRLISMGIPTYLLADALALSQAQRLVRSLCQYCKRPIPLTPENRRIFEVNQIPIPAGTDFVYQQTGCAECSETGYSGRLALMELCPIDSVLSDMVARNAPQSEMRKIAVSRGVLTLFQQGLLQVLAGNTSLEEISCLSYTSLDAEDNSEEDVVPDPLVMPSAEALEEGGDSYNLETSVAENSLVSSR